MITFLPLSKLYKHRCIGHFLVVALIFLCSVAYADAAEVTLEWQMPNDRRIQLGGYKLYYWRTGGRRSVVNVGNTKTYTLTRLAGGETYHFAVTAYSSNGGKESDFSNTVIFTLPRAVADNGSQQESNLRDSGALEVATIPHELLTVVSVDSEAGGAYVAEKALDGRPRTMWHTPWNRHAPLPHEIVVDLGGRFRVEGFRYLPRQDGKTNGMIGEYAFYVSVDGVRWGKAVATGTWPRNRREKDVRFAGKSGRFVRLEALTEVNGRSYTSAAEISILGTLAELLSDNDATPDMAPLPVNDISGVIPHELLTVVSVDSEVGGAYVAEKALDGRPRTMWHTPWNRHAPLPHVIVIDLGGRFRVEGLRYLPRQDGKTNGMIGEYAFSVSDDGVRWGKAVATGTWPRNRREKDVRFAGKSGRFVRLEALTEVNGRSYTSAAEISILGRKP